MAVSKKPRKSSSRSQTNKKLRCLSQKTETQRGTYIRIKRHRFAYLKKDEDFLALIKVGRLVNAVTFAMEAIYGAKDAGTPSEKRQYYRGTFIAGGYLHEGMELTASLFNRYKSESFFESLKQLRFSDEHKFGRRVLKEIRNSVAFHLDQDDKSTRAALSNLRLPRYDLVSAETDSYGDFYFDLADTIDLNYLIDVLKGDRAEREVFQLIFQTVAGMIKSFLHGGHEFLTGLGDKMNFSDHTD